MAGKQALVLTLLLVSVFSLALEVRSALLCDSCCYAFKSPVVPSFVLPAPLGTDTTLNPTNPIYRADGNPINAGEGCNGDVTEYLLDNGTWTSWYIDSNGDQQTTIDLFYATAQDDLNIRVIQSFQSNIAQVLNGRRVRTWITCNNGYTACLGYYVNNTAAVETTCPLEPSSIVCNSGTSLQSFLISILYRLFTFMAK